MRIRIIAAGAVPVSGASNPDSTGTILVEKRP
jgi:hypothetical protein